MVNKFECFLLFIILAIKVQGQVVVEKPGPIRFYNNGKTVGNGQSSGIVQVYLPESSSKWVNICSGGTNSQIKMQADVICHQLGYNESVSFSTAGTQSYGIDRSPSVITDLSCSSKDLLVIHQCNYTVSNNTAGCNDIMDLTVDCSSGRLEDDPFDTMVQIVDGLNVGEGRVEVYCNGNWGTVCSMDQDIELTGFVDLVCQQLGYTNALNWNHLNITGQNNQNIWMKDVSCPVTEHFKCVGACNMCPSNMITSCSHNNDMTIRCGYDKGVSSSDVYEVQTCINANSIATRISPSALAAIVICAIVFCLCCVLLLVAVPIAVFCCCKRKPSGAAAGVQGKSFNYANFDYENSQNINN